MTRQLVRSEKAPQSDERIRQAVVVTFEKREAQSISQVIGTAPMVTVHKFGMIIGVTTNTYAETVRHKSLWRVSEETAESMSVVYAVLLKGGQEVVMVDESKAAFVYPPAKPDAE